MTEILDKCKNCGKELHSFEGQKVHGSAAQWERCEKIRQAKRAILPLLPKVMELIESPEFMEQLKQKGYQVDAVALLALTMEVAEGAKPKVTIH